MEESATDLVDRLIEESIAVYNVVLGKPWMNEKLAVGIGIAYFTARLPEALTLSRLQPQAVPPVDPRP